MLNDPIPSHDDPRKLSARGTAHQGEVLLGV
ncbi:metal-binding protein, partial [Pseudomonas syringae pv. tagetis]